MIAGSFPVLATFRPINEFSSVDLPTFGTPAIIICLCLLALSRLLNIEFISFSRLRVLIGLS